MRGRDYQQPRPSFKLYSPKCVEGEFCKVRQNPAPTSMSVERAQIGFLGGIILSSSITSRMWSTDPFDPRPLRTYLLGRYSRCLSLKW